MTENRYDNRQYWHRHYGRTLSLLFFTILLTMLLSFGASAKSSAAKYTPAQAAGWIMQLQGQTINYWYPPSNAQCTELVYHYYKHLGASCPSVDAWRYADMKPPSKWVKIPYYAGFVAQEGDIAVWRGGEKGHVALIVSASAESFVSLDQNVGGVHSAHLYTHSYGAEGAIWFWGVIRPNFQGGRKDSHAIRSGKKMRNNVYYYEANDRNLVINTFRVWYVGNRMGGNFNIFWNDVLLSPKDYKVKYKINFGKKLMTCTIRGKGLYAGCRAKIRIPVS